MHYFIFCLRSPRRHTCPLESPFKATSLSRPRRRRKKKSLRSIAAGGARRKKWYGIFFSIIVELWLFGFHGNTRYMEITGGLRDREYVKITRILRDNYVTENIWNPWAFQLVWSCRVWPSKIILIIDCDFRNRCGYSFDHRGIQSFCYWGAYVRARERWKGVEGGPQGRVGGEIRHITCMGEDWCWVQIIHNGL